MSRYFGHVIVTFTDGTTQKVGGNRDRVANGVLTIWTDTTYGDIRDKVNFPLTSIRSWRWEDD